MNGIRRKVFSVIVPKRVFDVLVYLRVKASADRKLLENIILPFFANSEMYKRILFVGVANYTQGYDEMFSGREFWTIDRNPDNAKYGSVNHVVGSITDIENYFCHNFFDVILLCGVIGWGLNRKEDIEAAITGIHRCLDRKGVLVLGWNDTPLRNKIPLGELEALNSFGRSVFPPLRASEYRTNSRKYKVVFNFYEKR